MSDDWNARRGQHSNGLYIRLQIYLYPHWACRGRVWGGGATGVTLRPCLTKLGVLGYFFSTALMAVGVIFETVLNH